MTFIIAEMSANHGGSIDKAKEMIMAAKWAGCHAVKFQLYCPDDLPNTYDPTLHVPMRLMLPELGDYCARHRIKLVVSVFAFWAAEYLTQNYFPLYAYKFASPQSTRLERDTYWRMTKLIRAARGRLWISTGMSDRAMMRMFSPDVLFYCPPGHPAELDEGYLPLMRGCGFSDHTQGIIAPLAAAQAGATHIEKHFMLDDNCVDAAFSINPDQMKLLCHLCS